MAMTSINIKIDSELNSRAQSIFNALGLDISTAINMLLRKAIYQEELPFDDESIYLIEPDKSKTPVFGCMKDSIEIPPDFDEPLEEMKEYMW